MSLRQAALEIVELSKTFGRVAALDNVNLTLARGSFHALLGENGAGKSTLAKCVIGLYQPHGGRIAIDGQVRHIANPRVAHRLGVGMVHQHFSLVPNMTVAENLVIAEPDISIVIDWTAEIRKLERFCSRMPFRIDLLASAGSLAAGEKQKVEIVKQLYLGHRILILDEPTSVLTVDEADELFGLLQRLVAQDDFSVLLITHKLREVFKFADTVTVLRRGQVVAGGRADEFSADDLARHMVGDGTLAHATKRETTPLGTPILRISGLVVNSDKGVSAVNGIDLKVHGAEVVGIAGVSGNGQRELLEALAGQRNPEAGSIEVRGKPFQATRREMLHHKVFYLPEEPLRSASIAGMTLAENLAFRNFEQPPLSKGRWFLDPRAMKEQARQLVSAYRIKTPSVDIPIHQLSGGNIQRAVLARELSGKVNLLIASNPCFGLDVAAVAEIHAQLIAARNYGAAILLISEDLDELMVLSDRIMVMFEGRFVHETTPGEGDLKVIGRHMTGHRPIESTATT